MAESKAPKRNKISKVQAEKACQVAMRVHDGELTRHDGIRILVDQEKIKYGSAHDFIDNFKRMMRGDQYERVNSKYATEYFFRMVLENYGPEKLALVVTSVEKHCDYYKKKRKKEVQPGIRKLIETYRVMLEAAPASSQPQPARAREEADLKSIRTELDKEGEYDASDEKDARKRALRSIALRQGQSEFRDLLLNLYGRRCAITGCPVEAVLEAAHIKAYKGDHTNRAPNGLLLRSDIHTLFDLGYVAVDSDSMTLLMSPELKGTRYWKLKGRPVYTPEEPKGRPSKKALDIHREAAGL